MDGVSQKQVVVAEPEFKCAVRAGQKRIRLELGSQRFKGKGLGFAVLAQQFVGTLQQRFGGLFAPPAYSADNAAGIALLTALKAEVAI